MRFLRGYSSQCVDEALNLALEKTRDELLQKRPAKAKKVGDVVKKHWLCRLNLNIHHVLCIGEVAIYAINWFMPTASHKRKLAKLFYALCQMVAMQMMRTVQQYDEV